MHYMIFVFAGILLGGALFIVADFLFTTKRTGDKWHLRNGAMPAAPLLLLSALLVLAATLIGCHPKFVMTENHYYESKETTTAVPEITPDDPDLIVELP